MTQKSTTREAKQEILRHFMETTIAEAATEVFAKSGYQNATLDEIARRAGMSKGTIYLYYKNKDDLFVQVVEGIVNAAMDEMAREAKSAKQPLVKLVSIVRGKIAFYERQRDFFRIYLNEKQGLEVAPKDPHKRVLREMYLQGIQVLAQVLQEGMDAGVLRPMDSRRLAFFLQEMINTVLIQRIQGKVETSVDADAEQLLDLFLHGAQPSD
jgi:AcrR family transcriptional regulator